MNNKIMGIVLVLMFVLALGAGRSGRQAVIAPPTISNVPTEGGTLSDQLHLSPDQREKMQKIWEKVAATSQECIEGAKRVQKEQDDALMEMLTPEQRPRYQALTIQSADKFEKLKARRKAAFRDAVAMSNGILDETQRRIYMEIIKDRVGFLPDLGGENSGKE